MARSLPVYSSRDVAVTWAGINFESFGEDQIATINYNSDLTNEMISADGNVSKSITPDRSGTVVIPLLSTSPTNIYLSAILQAQELNRPLLIEEDFSITDPFAGSAICQAFDAHIKTAPEVVLGVDVQTYEWTFFSSEIVYLAVPAGLAEGAAIVSQAAAVADAAVSKALELQDTLK